MVTALEAEHGGDSAFAKTFSLVIKTNIAAVIVFDVKCILNAI